MTFGTRGDIQPYAALAVELARAGHEVVLAIPEQLTDLVPADLRTPENPSAPAGPRAPGPGAITVAPAGTHMLGLLRDVMPDLSGARDGLRTMSLMRAAMKDHLEETWRAAQCEPDVIVYHSKCQGAPHIAERLGIPAVLSIPLPFYTPTTAYPAPFFGGASFGRVGNRASYRANRLGNALYADMLSDFRQRIGLDGRVGRLQDPLVNPDGSPVDVLYPYSRHVLPVPPDYPSTAHVTGYWFLDSPADAVLSRDITDFLEADEPPVYIGFGSMGFGKGAEDRRAAVLEALERTGLRGIVATGWGGITPGAAADPRVLVIEGAPHDALFPHCVAVVHHGGAGSVAAGLRAGRPTQVVPFLGDQPFWGARLHELGVGPEPVPPRRLGRSLAAHLGQLVGTPAYARRAGEVAAGIRDEDGTAAARGILERIVDRWG
ncbi:glycosyltransferase [Brevibacterium samyangense]|uniref:Glycosyltransferase n=2 Tax=Brevibacterium samyangense TaxID=366888 RepID=A0ABN2TB92_9MICO